MKVIIQKPDLDTCLTALILGVLEGDEVVVLRGNAPVDDLENSEVLCIEAGGSGLTNLNNFDHHDPAKYFPPACKQAYDSRGVADENLQRLVEYVCMVDERIQDHPAIEFPSLSNIFSGMLLVEKDKRIQFLKGLEMLKTIMEDDLNPFSPMPSREEWQAYKLAKDENKQRVDEVLQKSEYYTAASGAKIGFVESDFIGGIGTLYSQGCDVVIMFNPAFGEPPVRKFTVAGNNKKVSHLLAFFDKIEKGWGGRETIIGSPREGTMIEKNKLLEIVIENL